MGSSFEDSPDAIPDGSARTIPHKQASVMLPRLSKEIPGPLFFGNKANPSSLNIPYPFLANTNTRKKGKWQIFYGRYISLNISSLKRLIKHLLKCCSFKTRYCSFICWLYYSKGVFFFKLEEKKEIEIVIWLSSLQAQQPINVVLVLYL